MAGLAEGLPVGLIPEEILVASMRDDVVDDVGGSGATQLGAVHTERVVIEVGQSRLLPFVVVATLA